MYEICNLSLIYIKSISFPRDQAYVSASAELRTIFNNMRVHRVLNAGQRPRRYYDFR